MSIGTSSEHQELGAIARRLLADHCPREVVRASLESQSEQLPPCWEKLAGEGWLGIHLPELAGGQGFGLSELGAIVEETGRAMLPGPFLPSVIAGAGIAAAGIAAGGPLATLLGAISGGAMPAAVYLGTGTLNGVRREGGALEVTGTIAPVVGGGLARVVLAPVLVAGGGPPSERVWCAMVSLDPTDGSQGDPSWGTGQAGGGEACDGACDGVRVQTLSSLDPTRRVAALHATRAVVEPELQLTGLDEELLRDIAIALGAAECSGIARWCLDTAVAYAKERQQFGRPIGQFQAVKHRLASMLGSAEQAAAVAWDALQALDTQLASPESPPSNARRAGSHLSATISAALALDAAVDNAKGCIQVLGGMGFTWEHDAHLYLRRALSLRQVLGGTTEMRVEVARLAIAGTRRRLSSELPAANLGEAERARAEIEPIVAGLARLDEAVRRPRMVAEGLVCPHWPRPWGRDASAVEQLVIDEELARAGVERPHLTVGAWVLPTLIAHGTEDQKRRFIGPTLLGEITWCQLFSEPGAGSDLASLTTRAIRGSSGWQLRGQKVWTSLADQADFGICLARTDPEAERHHGITYFVVDMHSPGIVVRPLRELTGDAMFNEVFLDGVEVPDDNVIGPVNGGWQVARTTLANERISVSGGSTFGFGAEALLALVPDLPPDIVLERVGSLLVEAQSLAVMSYRATLRVLAGLDPGPESSLRKLLGAEHEQRVQELALDLLGDQGAIFDGEGRRFGYGFLVTRCLTIAGGTSEVQRNLIGERLLGLPRDPEPARPEKGRVSNGASGNTCIGREGSESSPVGAQQRERR